MIAKKKRKKKSSIHFFCKLGSTFLLIICKVGYIIYVWWPQPSWRKLGLLATD